MIRPGVKAVILAGGFGTRLSEETDLKPKPMVEIGGKPILWHIMKLYSFYGVKDFIICCGYKGYVIKEYFANYFLHNSDVTFDIKDNQMRVHRNLSESWSITLVDTGEGANTGGRLKRVRDHLGDQSAFFFTYGDGVGNIDIGSLKAFHQGHGKLATLTATRPPARYGALRFGDAGKVDGFQEKPLGDGSWINGGFFVLQPKVIDLIEGDHTSWESDVLPKLALAGELQGFKHEGFWQPMDTLREKVLLNQLWESGNAPWKVWE